MENAEKEAKWPTIQRAEREEGTNENKSCIDWELEEVFKVW